MADLREQRTAVKFCFLLGKTGTETLEMLKTAYKGDALGKTKVFEWFSRFKSGEMSIEDQARSGLPSTARTDENVKKIHEIILEDRRQNIEEVTERSGVTWSSVQRILSEDLGMRRVAAKFVFSSQQCSCSHSPFCTAIFDQKWYDHCVPSTLFTRPGSLRLLFIPKNEKKHEREAFRGH